MKDSSAKIFSEKSERGLKDIKNVNKVLVVLKQYNILTQSLSSSSDARRSTHTMFITISSLVFLLIGASGVNNGEAFVSIDRNLLYLANLAGVFMSLVWFSIIFRYRRRSRNILRMLREIEEFFPIQIFQTEHELMWKNFPKIFRLMLSEAWIPFVFGMIHVIISFGIYFGFFKLGVV